MLLYGQHATLERIQPIAEALTEFGDVYGVDNPGFGGMDASYRIGQYPSLEFYAGHLKHFIDEFVPAERKVTLLGISFGFQIVAATLEHYPELEKRVEQAISFVGFVHPDDFQMPKTYSIPLLYVMSNISRSWLGSKLTSPFLYEPVVIGIYHATKPIQVKFKSLPKAEADQYVREQAWLWRVNDTRTHAATAWDFFKKNDLTEYRIKVPALHIGVPDDHFFDNDRVSRELTEMFSELKMFELALANHAPLDIDTPEQVKKLLPSGLKQLLGTSKNKRAAV